MIRTWTAVVWGKSILAATQFLKVGGGTAAPGYYALKLQPKLLAHFMPQFSKGSIIITGTNGKTTTSRLIAHFFNFKKIAYLHNRAGSNLERGIVSTCISAAHFDSKLHHYDYGLWEIDEAEFGRSLATIQPKYIIMLNLFRDQMDRYGEVDTTRRKWAIALKNLTANPLIIYNNDDPQLVDLIDELKRENSNLRSYGYSVRPRHKQPQHTTLFSPVELVLCPRCKKRLTVEIPTVAGQGAFTCTHCGFTNKTVDVTTTIEEQSNQSRGEITLDKPYPFSIQMPGLFNSYNITAAAALIAKLNYTPAEFLFAISEYKAAFGRLEKITINVNNYILTLIKNPTGFTESLKTINTITKNYNQAWFILNDNFADGKDVSWIWDVDLPSYISKDLNKVLVSGTRKYDMATRLVYAGIPEGNIHICNDWNELIQKTDRGEKAIPIFTTYTAMLDLQHYIEKLGIKSKYWSE
jgi:UDP-N-acetylmuramyl tripeptide synthase